MNRSDPTPRPFSADEMRTALRRDVGLTRPDYLTGVFAEAGRTRQRPEWTFLGRWLPVDIGEPGIGVPRAAVVLVVLTLLIALLVAPAVYIGSRTLPASVDLGIFSSVAGRVVYGDEHGIWGVDPGAPQGGAARVRLTLEAGVPLAWSSDGTRLLVMRGTGPVIDPVLGVVRPADERLFVLRADGSETQVTEQPMDLKGATIAPDGSRVVFAASLSGGGSALYTVDARGGSTKVLLADPGGNTPAYAPDGTKIAFVSGGGDHSDSVWVVNADGRDAHMIVRNESDEWPGHVRGSLAWSPAGDRIAVPLGGKIYTFAPDGSDFRQILGGDASCSSSAPCAVEAPYWSPDGAQIAYTTGCVEGAGSASREGCHLAIADADGSNALAFDSAASGPWHPARQ